MIGLVFSLAPLSAGDKGNVELPKDFHSWNHVKSMVIFDKTSPFYGFHHVYVNDKGLKAMKKAEPYPDGTVFVAPFYDLVMEEGSYNQGPLVQTVIMKKNKKFAVTDGWAYEAYKAGDPIPQVGTPEAAVEACHNCHAGQEKTDFIFSKNMNE
jgi:hypothetical protein